MSKKTSPTDLVKETMRQKRPATNTKNLAIQNARWYHCNRLFIGLIFRKNKPDQPYRGKIGQKCSTSGVNPYHFRSVVLFGCAILFLYPQSSQVPTIPKHLGGKVLQFIEL